MIRRLISIVFVLVAASALCACAESPTTVGQKGVLEFGYEKGALRHNMDYAILLDHNATIAVRAVDGQRSLDGLTLASSDLDTAACVPSIADKDRLTVICGGVKEGQVTLDVREAGATDPVDLVGVRVEEAHDVRFATKRGAEEWSEHAVTQTLTLKLDEELVLRAEPVDAGGLELLSNDGRSRCQGVGANVTADPECGLAFDEVKIAGKQIGKTELKMTTGALDRTILVEVVAK